MTHAQTRQTRSCQKNLPKIALRTHSSAVLIRVSTQETITLVRSETNPFPEVMATHLMTASEVTLQETLASQPFSRPQRPAKRCSRTNARAIRQGNQKTTLNAEAKTQAPTQTLRPLNGQLLQPEATCNLRQRSSSPLKGTHPTRIA